MGNRDLESWNDIIMNSSSRNNNENVEFFKNNPPLAEVTEIFAEDESTLGIFRLDNELYYAERKKNGYHRHSLIKVPSSVIKFIRDEE